MSRRSDSVRIDAAWREAMRQRLLSPGMLPERVDAAMAAWETEAERRGILEGRRYSEESGAWNWITGQAEVAHPAGAIASG